MRALDRKVVRDLHRMWAQALTIALVVAAGVATVILAVGSYRTIDETRIAYYERYRFADVFASVRRAPKSLVETIGEIPGVASVEARIAQLALLDLPGLREPATGQFLSLPDGRQPDLNRLHLRLGRLPDPTRGAEVVIDERFAEAHGYAPGAHFAAVMNGRKVPLTVVGVALSPEFVYAIGPGDRMPDARRFGVVWMSERALASLYDLEGAFSSVSLQLSAGASEAEVIRRLDGLLERYGGAAAYGRRDQTSHAFLDHGLDMLRNMSRTLPPVFLLVAAFLVNLTLSRLVALEREQVGLLKAFGYSPFAIAGHYLKFVLAIALVGIALGSVAGTLLGGHVTALYADWYRFPFLVFEQRGDLYLAAAVLSLAAALLGAAHALRELGRLSPAVAMQPPAPPVFRRLLPRRLIAHVRSQGTVMMLRGIRHHPVRAMLTTVGMALSTGILVVSLYLSGSMEQLIEVTYFMAERQDATVSFVEQRPQRVVFDMARLPGVLAVEPYREVPARVRHGNIERRVMLSGRQPDAQLSRLIGSDLQPVTLPQEGVVLSAWLADMLGVRVGDAVELDLLEGRRRTVSVPVSARVEDYFGLNAAMDAGAIARLMREAPAVNGVYLRLDDKHLGALYDALKGMPTVGALALQRTSLVSFREALVVIIVTMAAIYTGLAAIIAFGVVYNNARIALSERSRELASLRVLGHTRAEVFRILLLELVVLTLIAQPPGWAIGYALAVLLDANMAADVMRAPLVVERLTYVLASAIVIGAALVSAAVVRRRVNRLDLVSTLKTRE